MNKIRAAKVRSPDLPSIAIRRPRLERLIEAGSRQHRLTLVTAPAGYGKTWLLASWAAFRSQADVAWLTIDERDSSARRLGRHLVASLQRVRPGLGESAVAALPGTGPGLGDGFVDALIDDFEELEDDLVVVIDDIDRQDGEPVADDLARLLLESPPQVHYVLAGRVDPAVPLHRLRIRGEVSEIRVGDLMFTPAEAGELTEAVSGHRLEADELAYLGEITEGWPVAVALAAISLRNRGRDALTELHRDDRSVVDFLTAEVLAHESPAMRQFLLDISVLDQLNAGLCAAVTGRADATQLLADLERRSLFLVAAPGEGGWFRLHRLVSEYLGNDLRLADPSRTETLLLRAARWCAEHDEAGQAAAYYADAGAWDEVKELVFEQARSYWDRGLVQEVLAWVDAIPEVVHRSDLRLRITRAALLHIAGSSERALNQVADIEREHELSNGEQAAVDQIALSTIDTLGPSPDLLRRADRTIQDLPGLTIADVPDILQAHDPETLYATARAIRAKTLLFQGQGAAYDYLDTPAPVQTVIPAVFRVQTLGTVALLQALAGRPTSADAAARYAQETVSAELGPQHPARIIPLAACSAVARIRNDLDEAHDLAERAVSLAVRWRRWAWVAFLAGDQAALALVREGPEAALDLVRRGRGSGLAPPMPPLAAARLRAVELRSLAALRDETAVRQRVDAGLGATSTDVAAAAIAAVLAFGDAHGARKVLDSWPHASAPPIDLQHELACALVDHAEGRTVPSRAIATELLLRTAPEGNVRLYLDYGPAVVPLLESVAQDRPSRHLDLILSAAAAERTSASEPGLLSSREMEVLVLLPSRMSNAEIGRALFVSTHTIKTHVRHIYQKLHADGRDDAVRLARAEGLL